MSSQMTTLDRSSTSLRKPSAAVELIAQPRRSIIELLKRDGHARVEDIAEHIGVTLSGTRQHLAILEADGLVEHESQRGRPGRPRHFFRLSEAGRALFPDASTVMGPALMRFLEERDPALLDEFLAYFMQERINDLASRMIGLDRDERVQALAHSLEAEGFDAEYQLQGDRLAIQVRHCPLSLIATGSDRICVAEARMFEKLLPGTTISFDRGAGAGEPCRYWVDVATIEEEETPAEESVAS